MNDNYMEILSPSGEVIVSDNKVSDNIKTEELLIHAVYEKPKFKNITTKFFDLYLNNGVNIEDISIEFERLLRETLESQIDFFQTRIGVQTLRKKQSGTARRLKKRWYDATLESLDKKKATLLKKEVQEYMLKRVNEDNKESIQQDIINERINQLNEWVSSIFNPITDYPYLAELSQSKITSAFKHDIILCITEVLQNDYDHDISKTLYMTPGVIAPGMFIPQKQGRRVNHLDLTRQGLHYQTESPYQAKNMKGVQMDFGYLFSPEQIEYNPPEALEYLFTELNQDTAGTKATRKLYLDDLDLEIIRIVYRDIATQEGVRFKLSTLLSDLELPPSGKNYKKIEERILKLPCYTFTVNESDSNTPYGKRTFNLFAETRIFKDEIGNKVADVYYSKSKTVETATTTLMYKNELKKLSLPHSKELAYFLEGQRREHLRLGQNLKDRSFRFDFDHLRMCINYGKRKTNKEITSYLEEACIDISKNQFIIKEYSFGCGYLDVTFYEHEAKIKSLITQSALQLSTSQ